MIMKSIFFKLLSIMFLLLNTHAGVSNPLAQTTDFSKLVVFGDSLSDTGNLAFVDLPAPYFENRISNGPVAVDFLAQSIGSSAARSGHLLGSGSGINMGFNYAVAGGNIVGSDAEDLSQQVNAFLDRSNQEADENALYVVIIGGNDLRDLRSITDQRFASQRIAAIIAQLASQLQRLSNAGARAFLVANVANVGRIPETLVLQSQDPAVSIRAEQYVRQYNSALSQQLSEFSQAPQRSVVEFDLFQALENTLDNAESLGFLNSEQGCFDPRSFSIELECLIFGFNSRVFFDDIHPSARTYEIVAPQLIAAIPDLPSAVSTDESIIISPILQLLLDQ